MVNGVILHYSSAYIIQYQTSKSILFSEESTFVFVDYENKRAICL